jgi:hypothetical protein
MQLILPNFERHWTSSVRVNRHCNEVSEASSRWLIQGGNLSGKYAEKLRAVKSGLLASMCYQDAELDELRVCTDWMNWLVRTRLFSVNLRNLRKTKFFIDDLTDQMDESEAGDVSRIILEIMLHPDQATSGTPITTLTKE